MDLTTVSMNLNVKLREEHLAQIEQADIDVSAIRTSGTGILSGIYIHTCQLSS